MDAGKKISSFISIFISDRSILEHDAKIDEYYSGYYYYIILI